MQSAVRHRSVRMQLNARLSMGRTRHTCLSISYVLSTHREIAADTVVQYDVGGGSVFQVAADLNGVQYTAVEMGNGTSVSTSSSSSNSSTSGTGNTSGRTGSVSSTSNSNTGAASMTASSLSAAGMALVLVAAGAAVFA